MYSVKNRPVFVNTLLLLFFMFIFPATGAEKDLKPFSLVILPDTQDYTARYPFIFEKQVQWIKNNTRTLNIAFVVHLGDITNDNSEKQWITASNIMKGLDGIVPYALATGNHDLDPAKPRDLYQYNRVFPVSEYERLTGWGGTYQKYSLENSCRFFRAGGAKYLVLTLEFGPRDDVLAWANDIVKRNPDSRVIINTHCYMYSDNSRVGPRANWHPMDFPWLLPEGRPNDGEEIWHKLAGLHKNIFLVLSGHVKNSGSGKLASRGKHGNYVFQILSNFQDGVRDSMNGKSGYMRIMTFYPESDIVSVRTYSPYLNEWKQSFDHEFIIDMKNGAFKTLPQHRN
jgi:hypothetical protein